MPWGLLPFHPPSESLRPQLWLCVSIFRAPAKETVYCMNEAEMVDVALGILIEVTSVLSLLTPRAHR